MNRPCCLRHALSTILLLLVTAGQLHAAPWQHLFVRTRKRVEADPNKDYALGEEHGPWMIMASTLTGPDAEERAHALVQ